MSSEDKAPREVLPKEFIREIVNKVANPSVVVNDDIVDIVNSIVASFVQKTTEFSATFAKHRTNTDSKHTAIVEPCDVQIALEKLWGIRVPGYLLDSRDAVTTQNARKIRRIAGAEQNSADVVLNHHRRLDAARRANDNLTSNIPKQADVQTSTSTAAPKSRPSKRKNPDS